MLDEVKTGLQPVERLKALFYNLIERVAVKPEDVLEEAERRGFVTGGANVRERIESLQQHDTRQLDGLADRYIKSSSMYAGLQGFATGLPGALALPITLPADVAGTTAWFIRAFSGVMLSYGYYFDTSSEDGRALFLLELAAAVGIDSLTLSGKRVLIKGLSAKIMNTPYSKMVVLEAIRQLAMKFGIQLTKGALVAKGVPLLGGVFGAGMSVASVQLLGRNARRHFRKLHQEDRAKVFSLTDQNVVQSYEEDSYSLVEEATPAALPAAKEKSRGRLSRLLPGHKNKDA